MIMVRSKSDANFVNQRKSAGASRNEKPPLPFTGDQELKRRGARHQKDKSIQHIVVYLNRADVADKEIIALAEMELTDVMKKTKTSTEKQAFMKRNAKGEKRFLPKSMQWFLKNIQRTNPWLK